MAFAISGGQIKDLYKPAPSNFAPVRLSDHMQVEYADLWKTQPHVRTVVSFLARNVAQLGLHVFKRVSDLDRERITDHPLAAILSTPNPYTTQYRFLEQLVADMAIFDNAYFLKVKVEGQAGGLVRLDPQRVNVVGENPFAPEGYTIAKRSFKAEDVIHFRGYSPLDARKGVSPMETLRGILAEEHQATMYREQLWRNGARVSGYLERPAGAPQWSSEGKERFRSQWQAQYSGDGSRAGGTPILEDGMKYVPAATSPRDAQYVEARKLTREEVASAYHIPLPMVGILDHATFSNITQQHKMLYQDTLGPWLTMIQQEFALQLVPDFAQNEGLYVEFNLQEKLRGSFEEQAAQLQTAVGGPYMLRNEARARLNLPQIEGGNDIIVPLNLGTAAPADAAKPVISNEQATIYGVLIRAGVDPVDAARLAGMEDVDSIDAMPVTLRPIAEATPAQPAEPADLRAIGN